MTWVAHNKALFPNLEIEVDDVGLLEPHQAAALTTRLEPQLLADAIAAAPEIGQQLTATWPAFADVVTALPPAAGEPGAVDSFLWEIADWFVYVKEPEMYDALPVHSWDFTVVTDRVALDDRIVADVGAGTGKVTFGAAPIARMVYAVEPVARLRLFIDDKAEGLGMTNIETCPGTLDALPLPADSIDVLITCRAIGWNLAAELAEIGRVVKPGGSAMHLGIPADNPLHDALTAAGYVPQGYAHAGESLRSYVSSAG